MLVLETCSTIQISGVNFVRVNPCPPSWLRTLNSVGLGACLPLLKGIKEPSPSRRFAIPSTVLSSCPVLFVKTCPVPAGTVPQCLSHAGNSLPPLHRLAAPHPPPRPGPGACPLLVQSDAPRSRPRPRGRGVARCQLRKCLTSNPA